MIQSLPWPTRKIPEVLDALESRESGLTKEEAARRLRERGPNQLPQAKSDGAAFIFLRQFQSPLIYLLLGAAGVVFALGETIDGAVILAVLLFNATVGAIQEGKAQNTLLALKKFTETSATVIRDGREFTIPDAAVVVGDIIVLQEGEKVPADARIIFSRTLKIDEASLTGESGAVTKTNDILPTGHTTIVDQKNMVFKGTHVLNGHGRAVAVTTGRETIIGKIATAVAAIDTEIPLKANIRYLSRLIIAAVAVVSVGLVLLGVSAGKPLKEMFTTAVALAVSIIPEGLPVVMTLVLATGVGRMSKRHALVKRLQAVEALGQTKIIAVDKTGTLTRNEMVVQRIRVAGKIFEIGGDGYEPRGEVTLDGRVIDPLNHPELLWSGKIAAFCAKARLARIEETGAWKVSGDPTEAALLVFSEKIGFRHNALDREAPVIFELPFDYHRKYHGVIRATEGKNFLTVVGAPETVLAACRRVWHPDKTELLDDEKRRALESVFLNLARDGFRVVAYAVNADADRSFDPEAPPPLLFVGFFAMKDALRSEVKEAMSRVKSAGMRVVMVTGDHRLTAEAVAREAGIYQPGDLTLTGEEIDLLDDQTLAEKLPRVAVFARVTPDHKLRVIQAYRRTGEIVAMTGDGVNDAPSLVAADLGVAMGQIGTEVAKEAADIVLLDDNFGSIVSAAEEGRNIYKTIKRVILYLFSTSAGEMLVIVGAVILGYPLPLLPAQIIWLNLVTDGFLDVALAMEPKEPGLLLGKFEKPKKWLIDGLMSRRIVLMALPMALGALYLFRGYFATDLARASTIALTALAVFQWFNAWNCRSEDKSVLQMNPLTNKFLIGATALVILLQLLAVYHPLMQKVLRTAPLALSEWLLIIVLAASILLVEETRKFFYRRKLARARVA